MVKLVETVNNIQCINSIENLKVNEPLIIDLVVNDQLMTFEVDSGASVTIIPKVIFDKYFRKTKLKKEKCNLSSVNGEPITVVGQLIINVSSSKNENIKLPLIETENCVKKSLLGRSWLNKLCPEWKNIFNCHKIKLECNEINCKKIEGIKKSNENQVNDIVSEIKLKFPGVVKRLVNEEECIKDHEVNLELRENSVPKFQRAY